MLCKTAPPREIDFALTRGGVPIASMPVAHVSSQESRIKVVVRKRPLQKKETGNVIEVHPQLAGQPACLTLHEPKLKVDMTAYIESHKFVYDDIFDDGSSNRAVYDATAAPLISRLFTKGTTSTCFAYGATGAGKSKWPSSPRALLWPVALARVACSLLPPARL